MAAVNTRVVHQSNAWMNWMNYAWGREFKYDEAMMMGGGLKGRIRAASFACAFGAFLLGGYRDENFRCRALCCPAFGRHS